MCFFSKLEYIALYGAKNQNSQNKLMLMHTLTHTVSRIAWRGYFKDDLKDTKISDQYYYYS